MTVPVPTGSVFLDAMLGGGIPRGASVILQGPPGEEKETIAWRFLKEGWDRGESAIVAVASMSPRRLRERLVALGVDVKAVEESGRLVIIDWFSHREEPITDVVVEGSVLKVSVDLTNVGVAVNWALTRIPEAAVLRAVFEVISPALMAFDLRQVFRFAQVTKARIERRDGTALFLIEKEMHDGPTLSNIEQPFDGMIDIERVREGDRIVRKIGVLAMRALPMGSMRYVPFDLDPAAAAPPTSFAGASQGPVAEGTKPDRLAPAAVPPPAEAGTGDERVASLARVADSILAKDPRNLDALFAKAATLAHMGRWEDALSVLNDVTRIEVRYPGVWVLKAKVFERLGKPKMAASCRERAIELHGKERLSETDARPPPDAPSSGPGTTRRLATPTVRPATTDRATRSFTTGAKQGATPRAQSFGSIDGRGRVNEQGRTNGLVNGRGRTNGLVNGRGRTNGLVNGRGRTNGLVNGRGRTNGLVNGLTAARGSLADGLTNGYGLTNGLTTARPPRGARAQRWKLAMIPALAFTLLIAPLLAPEDLGPQSAVVIDGNFDDWPASSFLSMAANPGLSPGIDVVKLGIQDTPRFLAFYVEVAGAALQGGGASPGLMDSILIFVDSDGAEASGYRIDGLGADRMVEVSGLFGTIRVATAWEFDPARSPRDWNGWTKPSWVAAAAAGSRVEIGADWLLLDSNRSVVSAGIRTRSWDGQGDRGDAGIGVDRGSLLVVQQPQMPEVLMGPAVPILSIAASAGHGSVTFDALDVQIVGTATGSASAIRLLDNTGRELSARIPVARDVRFAFNPETVAAGTTATYTVVADIPSGSGGTFGVRLSPADPIPAATAVVTVRDAPVLRTLGYAGTLPAVPQIDGGFAEWNATALDSAGDPETRGNANVDLRKHGSLVNGSSLHVYTDVQGRIFAGTPVPQGSQAPPLPATSGTADFDRDTVPDAVDPLPSDFDNDGVPDANSNGDVDSDGVADFGPEGGTDEWLTTTIPDAFPAPYAGKSVSVYIGPNNRPVVIGEDVLRFFFDTDNRTLSGFAIAGLGADRMVELRGQDGTVTQSAQLAFVGSFPGDWLWTPLSPLTTAVGYGALEFAVPIGASAVYLEAGDFWGGVDSTSQAAGAAPKGASTNAAIGIRGPSTSFEVSPAANALDVPWQQVGPEVASPNPDLTGPSLVRPWSDGPSPEPLANTLIDANSQAITTRYNHQRKVVRAGDVTGDTACDATNSDGCWYTVIHDRVGSPESDFKDGSTVAVPATVGLLDSLVTGRSTGDNLLVAVVQFDNTGASARTLAAGDLELRRGTTTADPLIAENQFAIRVPADAAVGDGMFAVLVGKDASAPGVSTYGVFAAADSTGLNAEVKIVMFSGLSSSNSVFADGGSTAISTSATVLVSQTTSFPAASSSLPNILVAAVQVDQTSGQVDIDTPTGIEVRRDTTSLRGIEYKFTITNSSSVADGVYALIVAADSAAGASPTYDVRAVNANGASSSANAEAKLLVFRGVAATDLDTGSVSIGTTRTLLGTRTTTFAAGDDVLLGSIQINSPSSSRTYAAAVNDIRLASAGSGSNNAFAHIIGPLGGDLQVDMGSFTSPTGSGSTVTVTTGFQPKVFFLWTNGRNSATDTVGADEHIRGFGVGVSLTDRRAVCTQSQDPSTDANGGIVADSGVYHTVDAALCVLDDQGGTDHFDGQLEVDAILSNGFRLIVDPNMDEFFDSGAVRVHYLALGGSDLANIVTGEFTEPGATGNQDVTSLGFQPDAVILFSGMISSAAPAQGDDSTLTVGFAAGSGNPNDVVLAGASNNGADPMQTVSYSLGGESIALFDAAIAGPNGRAEVDAWLSNGFSLNWIERAASRRIFYVALQGGRHAVGDLLTSTSTTQFSETGLSFSPLAGLFMSHNKAQSTADAAQDHDEWSMGGVTTAATRRASCLLDQDNLATSSVGTAVEHDELYCNVGTSNTIEGLMDVVSVNSDGWTFVMDDADPAQSFVGYWAMAAGPATGASMFEAFVHKVSTGSANPSYEGAAQAPSTGSSGELKLLAIHIKNAGTDGDDRIILRRSSDASGSTWGSQIILASGNSGDSPILYTFDSAEPSIAIDASGFLHVVWVSASSSGDQSTLNRVRYTKTTVAWPTQSELGSSGNWEAVTTVDDASTGFMPTVSTDSSNNPHLAWSGSKTSGTVYYKNKAAGTWRSTVSWGTAYTGASVDVSPANNFVALARSHATPEAVIGYRSTSGGGVNVPKTRTWDGSSWSGETAQSTAGSPIWEVEIAWSPTVANTWIAVTLGDDGFLDAYVCTPSCSVTNNIGRVWTSAPSNPRAIFDLAYEQASGEALLVYGVVSTNIAQDIAYKTYTSSGWSSEQYLNDTGHNTDIQYSQIRLASKAGSDVIGMIGEDETDADANAWIWDGSAFGSFQEITATAPTTINEQVAVAFESSSGHLLAVSGIASSSNLAWAEYTTSWSSPTTINCANDNVEYIALKANPLPTANDMILATTDSFSTQINIHTCYWDSSAFAAKVNQDGAIDTEFERPMDFAWEPSESKGLLVYGTTSGQITYRTFTAPSSWGSATNVAYGSTTKHWVQARTNPLPAPGGIKILGAVYESGDDDLGAFTWDGTTFTVIGDTTFTSDTGDGSAAEKESFGLEYDPLGHEVQHMVCKDLGSSNCDASGEFTKWDGGAGYDAVSFAERGGYPSIVTTFESNGDLWIGYAKDVDGTTKAIYARFLNYPSTGWASAETIESVTGSSFTRPSIGVDKNNAIHALFVRTTTSELYYRSRVGGTWGAETLPSTETLTLGSRVAGTFATDLLWADSAYIQYREGGQIGAVGYKSSMGSGVNLPKQLDWTSTSWGTPETELATAGAAVENVRVLWDASSDSTLFWILVNTGANIHAYKCTSLDTCSKEDVDPSSGNDYAVTQTVGTAPERHWDAAIEATSGELLLAYDNPAAVTNDFCYRTRTSGSSGTWSSETCFDHSSVATSNPSFAYVVLASNPASNRIGFGAFDTTNDDFVVAVWDGSSWVNANKAVSTGVTLANGWGGTVVAEDSSDEFVAYAGNGANAMAECEWTSAGGWESTCVTTFDPNSVAGNDLRIIVGVPLLGTDKSMVCQGDDLADITCWRWSGAAGTGGSRGTVKVQTTNDGSAAAIDLRVGYAWNSDQTGTADGLVVYYANTAGSVSYDTYNDATDAWAGASTFSSAGSHKWVELAATTTPGDTTKVHIVTSNSNNDVLAYRWGGTGAPANEQSITADTVDQNYPYWDLALQNGPSYHLNISHGWTGVPSGATYSLSVKGYRSDENVDVKVLTPPSTWNTRITISATSNTAYSYALTTSEYNSGAPSIRFTDPSGSDTTQSDFYLDLGLVVTDHTHVLVSTSADNPTIMVRAPTDETYGIDAGGVFWKISSSETYFFAYFYVPEFDAIALPAVATLLFVLWRRGALRTRRTRWGVERGSSGPQDRPERSTGRWATGGSPLDALIALVHPREPARPDPPAAGP